MYLSSKVQATQKNPNFGAEESKSRWSRPIMLPYGIRNSDAEVLELHSRRRRGAQKNRTVSSLLSQVPNPGCTPRKLGRGRVKEGCAPAAGTTQPLPENRPISPAKAIEDCFCYF